MKKYVRTAVLILRFVVVSRLTACSLKAEAKYIQNSQNKPCHPNPTALVGN